MQMHIAQLVIKFSTTRRQFLTKSVSVAWILIRPGFITIYQPNNTIAMTMGSQANSMIRNITITGLCTLLPHDYLHIVNPKENDVTHFQLTLRM